MLRIAEHLAGQSVLDDFAVLHHGDEIADLRGDAQIVRDEDDGEPKPLAQIRAASSAPAPAPRRRAPRQPRRATSTSGFSASARRGRCAGVGRRRIRREAIDAEGSRPTSRNSPSPACLRTRGGLGVGARRSMRWRWPPENLREAVDGRGIEADQPEQFLRRRYRLVRGVPCTIGPCATRSPALRRGFSEANGS